MEKSDIQISKGLYEYMLSVSLREHDALRELREVTAKDPSAIMLKNQEHNKMFNRMQKDVPINLALGNHESNNLRVAG